MKTRIITAIVAICILLPVLFFSGTVVFPIAIALVSAIAVYEMMKCIGLKELKITLPLYLFALAGPFLVRYAADPYKVATLAFVVGSLYLLYLFALSVMSHGKYDFAKISTVFTVALYIIISFSLIIYIRDFGEFGKYLYLLIFIGAWVTDTFAYFTGVFFGKHKLIPDVSPKKTVEGSIGGIFFCVLSFVVFGIVTESFFGTDANLIFLAVGGLVMSLISQIGDLIMSVIKRHYGIKDYGKLFPGHGGMLDRFDSVLAVALGVAAMCMVSSLTGINIL
ncbi:MAG: phosphatidate cytidylyltransferase [Ruminococcaceae bacterium]|nr:phosphatidate cytidylyltransferase [Oscillospiraceae bacterium]